MGGLPSGDKCVPVGEKEEAARVTSVPALTSPIEDVVQIATVLECRQYSQNMSETYGIRTGQVEGQQLRHILLTETLSDQASKKVMRLLKGSLLKKRNLLDGANCPPPTRLIKGMKHYYVAAPRNEWVRAFAGLVQSLLFPRALIFCDDSKIIGQLYREMQDLGVAVSANLPPGCSGEKSGGESLTTNELRRRAVQDFTANRTQFLLTHSEPAVCQIMLPKVSCVFHFGIPQNMPSIYGVRLMPLDAKLAKESASILLVDSTKAQKAGSTPSVVADLAKLFSINFMDMPWEFLPEAPMGGMRR